MDAGRDRPDLGRTRPSDARLDARHRGKLAGGRAGGRPFGGAALADGRLDAADPQAPRPTLMEAGVAGAFHCGEHLGGGASLAAGGAAGRAHRLHQRAGQRLHRLRDRRDARGLSPRRRDADADQRGAVVSHAARLSDVDLAQRARADRSPRAWIWPRARAAFCPLADRARSDVERHRRRDRGLCGASRARGTTMSALSGEFGAWLALVLVGFLPNEVWRWLAVIFSRGLDEDAEILLWVRAVATAILAGVIAKLTIFSPGVLAAGPPRRRR